MRELIHTKFMLVLGGLQDSDKLESKSRSGVCNSDVETSSNANAISPSDMIHKVRDEVLLLDKEHRVAAALPGKG